MHPLQLRQYVLQRPREPLASSEARCIVVIQMTHLKQLTGQLITRSSTLTLGVLPSWWITPHSRKCFPTWGAQMCRCKPSGCHYGWCTQLYIGSRPAIPTIGPIGLGAFLILLLGLLSYPTPAPKGTSAPGLGQMGARQGRCIDVQMASHAVHLKGQDSARSHFAHYILSLTTSSTALATPLRPAAF